VQEEIYGRKVSTVIY